MLSRDDHDDLIVRLYASAMGDTPWTDTLERLSRLFGVSASVIQVSDASGGPLAVENYGYSTEFATAYYASEAYANDPRVPCFRRLGPGTIYFDHGLFDMEQVERNPWCRESIDILKVKYQLGAVVSLPTNSVAALALLSTEEEGHASEAAILALRRLAPHLEQAVSLGYVLEHRAATQAAMLDALARKADGVILLDDVGAPTFMNDAARAVLAAGDGLAFSAGAFVTRRGPETRRLQGLIGDAIAASREPSGRPGGQMLVTRPSGWRPYILRIMPAPSVERFLSRRGAACVIYLQDLAASPAPSKASLGAVFGLTGREADFAIELVRSASLSQAAANAGMAVNTARNHLQSIFRKTGAANQAEAVQLFGRLL